MTDAVDTTPGAVDALLVLSFGGPEGQEDVIPFLENVTRGRGVPRERLEEVATHYRQLGGRSPINELNLEIIANVKAELARRGRDLPVYFGNRNWTPMVEDTVQQMAADGVRNAAVFATSAWGGYSGCAQYQEDIARARDRVDGAPTLTRLRHFYDHPLFVERFATDLRAAVAAAAPGARVVFAAHSVPEAADAASGPPKLGGHLYSRQVVEASRLVAEAAGVGEQVVQSIEEYNFHIVHSPEKLQPSRVFDRREINEAPFYALVVEPAITFTHDGLKVDKHARVLNKNGEPIEGLYAAGADAGNIYNCGYAGGLALALTFALAAVKSITAKEVDVAMKE